MKRPEKIPFSDYDAQRCNFDLYVCDLINTKGMGEELDGALKWMSISDTTPKLKKEPDHDYHDPAPYIEKQAKKLKKRYNSFYEWQDAVNLYYDYLESLEDRFDMDFKLIKAWIKSGFGEDLFVPKKPKLRNKRLYKRWLKSGRAPQRSWYTAEERAEKYSHALDGFKTTWKDEDIDYEKVFNPKRTKKQQKVIDKSLRNGLRKIREFNTYSADYYDKNPNIVEEFYGGFRPTVDEKGYVQETVVRDPVKDLKKMYEWEYKPEWEKEADLQDDFIYYNGRHVDANKLDLVQLYKQMVECGWKVPYLDKGTKFNKETIDLIKREVGANVPMTKKDAKKWKKRQKKAEKLRKKQQEGAEKILSDLTGFNRAIFSDANMDRILDFTFDNLKKEFENFDYNEDDD